MIYQVHLEPKHVFLIMSNPTCNPANPNIWNVHNLFFVNVHRFGPKILPRQNQEAKIALSSAMRMGGSVSICTSTDRSCQSCRNRKVPKIGDDHLPTTRWAPNSNKWPYKRVTGVITLLLGVITPFITGRGPPCRNLTYQK